MSKIRYRIGFFSEAVIKDSLFSILNGINDYATKHNIDIIRFTSDFEYSNFKYDNQYELLVNLSEKFNLDGILTLNLYSNPEKIKKHLLKIKNIPIISLGSQDNQYNSIYQDGTKYIEQLIEHLIIEHHYTKILYVCPIIPDERLHAYSNIMKKHNHFNEKFIIDNSIVKMPEQWNIKDNERIRIIYSKIKESTQMNFDAIFIPYAEEAHVFCELLKNDNYKIPEDIAVTTGEEISSCITYSPPLTTIFYPFYEIGYLGCDTLHNIIKGENTQKNIIIPSKISFQQSCGCNINNNVDSCYSKKYIYDKDKIINSINDFGLDLITCFNFDKMQSLLNEGLTKFDITSCLIFILNNQNIQNLIPWYISPNNPIVQNNIDPSNSYFDFDDLFKDNRHTYLVYILNVRNDLVGFNIYEYNNKDNNIYSLITTKIATAIKTTNVHEELKKAKLEIKQQSELLKYTQKQLIQTEKISSLTNLIVGITNELNSPVGLSFTKTSLISETTQQILDDINQNQNSNIKLNDQLTKIKDSSTLTIKNLTKINSLIKTFKMLSTDLLVLEKRVFNLKDYLNDILVNLILKINKYKHKIEIYCDKDLNINSYPGIFSIIITNLISNTLKHSYCEQDFVEIQIKVLTSYNKIELVYQDKGKKISNQFIPKIFEPFFTTNRSKGLGLGLHIVYNLVTQKLNGNIKYQNASLGNIFTITFDNE